MIKNLYEISEGKIKQSYQAFQKVYKGKYKFESEYLQ